jgi:anti-sigma factor RsiW
MTPPNDRDLRLLVHAYLDRELDPAHALEVERQLMADPALAAERDRIEALRRAIKERLPREALPPGLERRIQAQLRASEPRRHWWNLEFFVAQPSWRALAASVAVAMVLASGATWFVFRPGQAQATGEMVVASHVRALMAAQPIDVASSDRHTVKPWFNGRITESPRVVDLSNEGFVLVGGRIDVIGRTPVATLVYRIRQHLISLTAVPGGRALTAPRAIAGYNIVSWTENGVVYWAVSDVVAADLQTFAQAFRQART